VFHFVTFFTKFPEFSSTFVTFPYEFLMRNTKGQVFRGMSFIGSNVSAYKGSGSSRPLGLSGDSLSRVLRVTMEVTRECKEDPPEEHA